MFREGFLIPQVRVCGVMCLSHSCASHTFRTVDTLVGVTSTDPSVHLTVGVDTHIWGLTYGSLRTAVLAKGGVKDELMHTKLADDVYWSLQVLHRICLLSCLFIDLLYYLPLRSGLLRNFVISAIGMFTSWLFKEIDRCERSWWCSAKKDEYGSTRKIP